MRANGGYGLANLKSVLVLDFKHHDAGEDARAAAEVVLLAKQVDRSLAMTASVRQPAKPEPVRQALAAAAAVAGGSADSRIIGEVEITQANVDHSHIYLRSIVDRFPADAIGGPNKAAIAPRQVSVDYGAGAPIMTDIDGSKKFFRNRSLAREFFSLHGARAGDFAVLEQLAPYQYRLRLREK